MKTGFKHGLILLVGLVFSIAAMAKEPVPIEDRDVFEKQLITCIMSELENDCIISLFSAHLDPDIEDRDDFIINTNSFFKKELENSSVYEIHVIDKVIKADLFDSRTYIIEYSSRKFLGLHISFTGIEGKWYVSYLDAGDSEEFIRRILGLPPLPDNAGNELSRNPMAKFTVVNTLRVDIAPELDSETDNKAETANDVVFPSGKEATSREICFAHDCAAQEFAYNHVNDIFPQRAGATK
jgi:hypothetical protein